MGNICVDKFMGLESGRIFRSIKGVRSGKVKSLNPESVRILFNNYLLTEWEALFYLDIMGKRALTPRQAAKKEEINRKAVKYLSTKSSRHNPILHNMDLSHIK